MTPLTGLEKEPFENIVGKGEIACTCNFSFSHNVFYSIKHRNYHVCYTEFVSAIAFNLIWSFGNGLRKFPSLKALNSRKNEWTIMKLDQ